MLFYSDAMDLRHLKTLLAIAEHRTFVAAADVIGLTQSAVSLHVKALEDELGARLFDRTRRPPALTAEGRTLVERAREIVRLCNGLGEGIHDERLAGTLRLGVVPTCLTGMMPLALASLRAAQPHLGVRVISGPSADLADGVRKGRLDVAMVSEPMDLATGLVWRPVVREPLMVIAPENAPGKTGRELLETLPYIRFQKSAWAGQMIDLHLRDREIRVTADMEIDSLEAISELVAHGLGVSVVPRRQLAPDFPPGVRALPFGDPPLSRAIGLVERVEGEKVGLVNALFQELLRLSDTSSIS
ncbi:MAG: LysR family transcriptional regulator [Rhodospirillaceae bacterium]|nr:LysR family transcriptional regulator [Rhodospirillaceae bacterium]